MNKTLPDKYIRKALYDRLNGLVVDGHEIPLYDYRATPSPMPSHYILASTQSSLVNKANKCEYRWDSSILINIVTSFSGAGNPGSSLLADDIAEEVRKLTQDLTLDTDLRVVVQTMNFEDIDPTINQNENIFRKVIRYELIIE